MAQQPSSQIDPYYGQQISESLIWLFPYLAFCAVCTAGFALFLRPAFSEYFKAYRYCFIFSFFGIVVAYFMSLGLREGDNGFVNELLEPFAAALISLLSAGIAYFASKFDQQSSDGTAISSRETLPVAVVCFLFTTVAGYKAFSLELHWIATKT